MGQLRIALRAYASEGHRPDAVLSRASRFLDGHAPIRGGRRRGDPATRASRPACTWRSTRRPAPWRSPAPATPTRRSAWRDGTVLIRPTAGGLPLGIDPDADYPTTRLVLEPGETHADLHGRPDRDRRPRPGHRLARHPHDPGGARRTRATWRSSPTPWSRPCTAPSSHHTTGPLADRREDDIARAAAAPAGDG